MPPHSPFRGAALQALGLSEGLAAGKGNTVTERVALNDFQQPGLLHGNTPFKGPGLRVMAAGTVVWAALRIKGSADARTVYDAVLGDAGQIKHGWKDRA